MPGDDPTVPPSEPRGPREAGGSGQEPEPTVVHKDTGAATGTPFIFGTEADDPTRVRMPGRLGQYRIVRVIGEGGMGVVYEAEQTRPHRRVALKVIRPGYATAEMLARFEYEAEVLGRLQHPGIAAIFEAGTFQTPFGSQPFFAMEFVDGLPLSLYVEQNNLGTRDRLELMARVCEAVQHAHSKGIIHRDLKPANVLVDSSGQPKVLDFGVARLTDSDLKSTTLRTDIGQLIGTIAYMSPEQASGEPTELDTRSDVYALGVVCYELVAGQPPYDLRRKLIHEAVRVIREDDPVPLSSIDRVFRGDIETIVAKALSKAKERRYQTANDLAADIRRYLRDEPIVARPPNAWYQLSKFTKRNRSLMTALAAVAVIVPALLSAWAVRERFVARRELALRTRADEAAGKAVAEAAAAKATRDFMVETVKAASPKRDGPPATVLGVFERGAPLIDQRFAKDPRARAALHEAYGDVFFALNEYDRAEHHLREALRIHRDELGEAGEAGDAVRSLLDQLGVLLLETGRSVDAAGTFAANLGGRRPGDPGATADDAAAWQAAGGVGHNLGDYDAAEYLFSGALATARAVAADDPLFIASIEQSLGRLLLDEGRAAEAEPLIDAAGAAIAADAAANAEHPGESIELAYHLLFVGYLHQVRGRTEPAIETYRRARDMFTRLHDDQTKAMVSVARMELAGALQDAGPGGGRGPGVEESDFDGASLGGPVRTVEAMHLRNRARILWRSGRTEQAATLLQQALDVDGALAPPDGPLHGAHTKKEWAVLIGAGGATGRAEALLNEAIEAQRRHLDQGSTCVPVAAQLALGRLLLAGGRAEGALTLFEEAARVRRASLGEAWPTSVADVERGAALIALGRRSEAEALLGAAVAVIRRECGVDHPARRRAEEVLHGL